MQDNSWYNIDEVDLVTSVIYPGQSVQSLKGLYNIAFSAPKP